MADGLMLTPAQARRARNSVIARNRANAARYMVSGELVTRGQIAKRLGIAESTAIGRLRKARARPGRSLTWEMLA